MCPAIRARRSRTWSTCWPTPTTFCRSSASASRRAPTRPPPPPPLAASVNYPLRGAATFKSTVGTNVASDALANLASSGVTGGALIIVGEDYGEGSSIMQERSHAFAMKSQIWLLDPRPNLPSIVRAVEKGFELSEASNTPVMLELRIRACHVYGSFTAKRQRAAGLHAQGRAGKPGARHHPHRAAAVELPARAGEDREALARGRALRRARTSLNEFFDGDADDIGIVMQGGMYNNALRALEVLGLADIFGDSRIPLYVLNVTYPLIDAEFVRFCAGKKAILMIEEGQPEFIEQAVNTILRRADVQTRIEGKGMLPMAGEYTGGVMREGVRKFFAAYRPDLLATAARKRRCAGRIRPPRRRAAGDRRQGARPAAVVLHRLPGAADLRRHEAGRARARAPSRELRHRLPPVLGAAAVQSSAMPRWATGLGGAGAAAFNRGERASARSRSSATADSGTTALPRASATRCSTRATTS